ncbi:MAG: tetratricopeptide repeat protein, partial [Armatimonadetes bacterium]|nr:tetratricopeptide repeat protein [Armatimonadota bacterium]
MRWTAFLILLLLSTTPLRGAQAQSAEERLAEASALFDAKRYEQAATKLDQFLTLFAQHEKAPNVALALGRCYTELKQYGKAVPAYERAATIKDPMLRSAALLGLGEAAVQTSQWPVAIRALEEAARGALKPEQGAVVWYWLGEAYFEQKQYAQAEMAYARVVSQFPENSLAGGAGYAAALAALRQGKNDGAQQYARGVVDRTPRAEERPRAQLLLAQLELDARRPRDARKGFEAVLADTSAAAREASVQDAALEGLVQALLDLNEHGVAAEHLQTLVGKLPATEPRRFRALLALGTCRFRQKQYEGALTAYRDAAQTPDGAVAGEALYWAANTLTALERHGEAAAEYDRLLKKHPNHAYAARAQLRQGDALVAAKQPAEASRAYRRVIEKYPEAEQAKEARQALVDLTGRTTDPVALAELLRALPPAERARGAARLARLHLEGRKFAEAERALNELLAELPAGEAPAESRYLLGVALEGQEKPEPAAAALAEAVRKEPAAVWAGDAHSRLAWLYLDLKRPADAEQAARAALSGQPMPATRLQARLALVQSLLGQERWEPTLTEARAFLETNPPQE